MTPTPPPRSLRVLLVWPDEAFRRLESRVAALGAYGRLRLDNVPARELPAMARPNRYDILAVPNGVLAELSPTVRQNCAKAVWLLVLTDSVAAPDDLLIPGIVSLGALSAEAAMDYLAILLVALSDGETLETAADLARRAAADWPEPPVRVHAADAHPRRAPTPPAPATPSDKPSGGSGNINFFGAVTAGHVTNITNPSAPVTLNSSTAGRDPGQTTTRDPAEQARLNHLLAFMDSACTLGEIETLCFQLGVNPETFGRLGTRDLAWRLLDVMSQRGRVNELIARLADAVPERANELP